MKLFTRSFNFCLQCAVALVFAVATPEGLANDAITVPLQKVRSWDFGGVHFDCNFSGARLGGCEQTGEREFKVLVTPENEPINPSPWFAFKVRSDKRQKITVKFAYTYAGSRSHSRPMLSGDGENWSALDAKRFFKGPESNCVSAIIEVGPRPCWVASWELSDLPHIAAWTDKMCRLPFAREESAGRSIEGRNLRSFVLGETTNQDYVFVIGRQHPPEITGTMGLESFVETLAANTSLASRFRHQFQTVVVPLVNPDGVEHGHWRSNLGGVDLNRDWKDFSQPETAALRDYVLSYIHKPGAKVVLFLDFHSTGTNVFYSVPEEKGDGCAGFTDHWLAALQKDCPKFHFERDDSHNATEPTSKAWAHSQIHGPSITCEFGYRTDRRLIATASRVEASEMMKLLLPAGAGE